MVSSSSTKRGFNVFQLTMIAIISVDSLRNLPIVAQYGLSLITFYAIAGVFFLLPLAWVTSQLAVRFPHVGGSYLWIEAAFGKTWGYLSIWLLWVYNIIWYPTIFAFISSILASLIYPSLTTNPWFILIMCVSLFWLLTFIHFYGIKVSGWISTFSAIVGTLFPMFLMIGLAIFWLLSGKPSAISFHVSNLLPSEDTLHNLAYFSNFLFSLLGLEVIAVHASNVSNPAYTYPRTLLISTPLILITLVLSSLALCVIIPPGKLMLLTGIMDVFHVFFTSHFPFGSILIGWCIIVGGLGMASSWIIGLARGLHIALTSMAAPKRLLKLNRNGIPINVLCLQAVVYTVLLSAFLLLPNVNNSYWLLSALTAQFALIYYVLLFAAAIKLFRSEKNTKQTKLSFFAPLCATIISIIGIIVGFLPPSQISESHTLLYQVLMALSLIVFCLFPFLILKKREVLKKS